MDMSNDNLRQLADLPASPYRFPEGHRVWGRPETARVQVSLNPAAYQEIMSHAHNQGSEVGGVLLGYVFRSQAGDAYHVSVEKVLAALADPAASTGAGFRLDETGFAGLLGERDRRFPQYTVVGWYHTRENAAVLPVEETGFSPRQSLFTQPWQVELVVDPTRNEGYFYWVNEQGLPAALPGYYERIHPGFGWSNWGKPAGGRAAAAAAAVSRGEEPPRKYTIPLIAAALALIFLCSLAFTFLNWQRASAERDRTALDLQDMRYQLDQAVLRIRTLQPALFMVTPGPVGTEVTTIPGLTLTPGGEATLEATLPGASATSTPTPTPSPTPTNATPAGSQTPGTATPTLEATFVDGTGYPPPYNTPTEGAGYTPP